MTDRSGPLAGVRGEFEPEPAPKSSRHTDELLREIGIDESDVATPRRDGVVG
jgi:hypothetical protein